MPNWSNLLSELKAVDGAHDHVRRKYLVKLHEVTGRNVIVYYSGWLQKSELSRRYSSEFQLNDSDIHGFMAAIHDLDRAKGLDLLLHTPGGSVAATEALVGYLRSMFTDIRAIVPQLAMSAGTMIALACGHVLMGKHSSLGPIDPQISGLPAHGIIEEFERAFKEISENSAMIPVWQPIIAKYSPTLVGECEKAINWSEEMVKEWLITGMFREDDGAEDKAKKIVEELASHPETKTHERHISLARVQDLGIEVTPLEDEDDLQDAVLTVHHACIQTLADTSASKIIENHHGVAFIQSLAPTSSS